MCLSDVPYEVTVYTSDMMGAGTSASVYLVLHGSEGTTEEVLLADTSKKKRDSFKRGSVDQFVKEVSLGDYLDKVNGNCVVPVFVLFSLRCIRFALAFVFCQHYAFVF